MEIGFGKNAWSERKIGEDGKPRKSVYWKEVSLREAVVQAEAGE